MGMQQVFSGKYDQTELAKLGKQSGNPEEQIKALLTPEQKAAYQGYQREEASYNAQLMANTELLQMQSTLGLSSDQQDRVFATLYEISFSQQTGSMKLSGSNQAEQMQFALDQKAKALESVLTPIQLENYRQQQTLQVKLVNDIWSKMQADK